MKNFISFALLFSITLAAQAGKKAYNLSHFKADYQQGFFEKLFSGKKRTHSELIITPKIRENALLDDEDDFYPPDWDYETPLTKIIIFKKKSGLFSKAKNIKPVKYGLANEDDLVVCEAENTGLYTFTDEDLDYLNEIYGVKVDPKNKEALISYYQPICLFNEKIKKRLIAFDNAGEIKVAAFKYDRDFYHYWIRKDYNWINETTDKDNE